MIVKGLLYYFWGIIDIFYYHLSRLESLAKQHTNQQNVLRVRMTRYKGYNVTLSDGTEINYNDRLIKIHLHNIRILKETKSFKSELKKAKWIYQAVERSLPEVAQFIKEHEKCSEIKGIIGITNLTRRADKLGFETKTISNGIYRRFKWLLQLPIMYLSSSDCSIKSLVKQQPHYLFMSKETLFEKYGQF